MTSKSFTFRELVIRFNWIVAFFVFIVFCVFIRLGLWQFDRAQEKIQLQENYTEMGESFALPIEDVSMAGLEADALTIQNLHVSLRGEFQNDKTLYLIYQAYEGYLGYAVITPFLLDSSDKIVFVNRGWFNASTYDELKKHIEPINGEHIIEGQVFVPTPKQADRSNDIDLSDVEWPVEIRYLNTLELAHLFSQTFFPYEVRLDENQPGVLIRHWPTVAIDTGRNFSYSLQWFSMSIALLIVTLILSSNILELLQKRSKPL
tara:strand:- start:281 stop:1063 length:783 start_codon:yes stop_codon:yes gene_type:complete